jgi:hypothetical protein
MSDKVDSARRILLCERSMALLREQTLFMDEDVYGFMGDHEGASHLARRESTLQFALEVLFGSKSLLEADACQGTEENPTEAFIIHVAETLALITPIVVTLICEPLAR